jgi:spectinomycin phosphotransferase
MAPPLTRRAWASEHTGAGRGRGSYPGRVKKRPDHLDQRELAHVLSEQWGLAPGRLRYLPVGFGDHHWELTGAAGRDWFVTVAELAGGWRGTGPADGYADLQAAMEIVIALSQAGMEFAVAPVRTTGGQALAPLGQRNAVTVFPYVDVMAGDFGDEMPEPDRLALVGILARLHDATPLARRAAPARGPIPASRSALEAAVGELGQPWHGGPYSEPARQLLARHAPLLGRALARFDELVREAAESGPVVVTGRRVSSVAVHLYRMRWSLDDISLAVRDFRGPHEQDEDTGLMWETLTGEIEEIRRFAR